MQSAFIIHGSNGSNKAHWYPWLKERLEERGFQVFLPQFPVGEENQTLNNWLATLKPMQEYLEGSIMIGHSLGVPFILNILNQWGYKIQATFLVSGFVGHLEAEGKTNLDDFADKQFDWKRIKENCKHFYILHSDNDSYIPLERAEKLAKYLETSVILVKGAGHFQEQSGYKEFELLIEKVKEVS